MGFNRHDNVWSSFVDCSRPYLFYAVQISMQNIPLAQKALLHLVTRHNELGHIFLTKNNNEKDKLLNRSQRIRVRFVRESPFKHLMQNVCVYTVHGWSSPLL